MDGRGAGFARTPTVAAFLWHGGSPLLSDPWQPGVVDGAGGADAVRRHRSSGGKNCRFGGRRGGSVGAHRIARDESADTASAGRLLPGQHHRQLQDLLAADAVSIIAPMRVAIWLAPGSWKIV